MQPSRESEPTIAILELVVDNHAGTMSHICGLFARRAFSLEGILCLPVGDGSKSRMWLRVPEQDRLQQVVLQLEKLEDVVSVRRTAMGGVSFQELARRCLPAQERLADGVAD
jgi:acetolactate synthase-1/3 small subunit